MRLMLSALIACLMLAAGSALAIEPPSAQSASLPEEAVAKSREAAEYIIDVQTDKWVSGPSFTTGKNTWYLHGKILFANKVSFANDGKGPFRQGGDILLLPYCVKGTGMVPFGGPGRRCAEFMNKKLRVWGLLADMQARRIKGDTLLIQAENLLDSAFIP